MISLYSISFKETDAVPERLAFYVMHAMYNCPQKRHITEQSSNMSTTIFPLNPLQVHTSLGVGSLRGSNWMLCLSALSCIYIFESVVSSAEVSHHISISELTHQHQYSRDIDMQLDQIQRNALNLKVFISLFQNDNHLLPCQSFVSFSQNDGALKNSFSLLRNRTLRENILFYCLSFCLFCKLITKPQR